VPAWRRFARSSPPARPARSAWRRGVLRRGRSGRRLFRVGQDRLVEVLDCGTYGRRAAAGVVDAHGMDLLSARGSQMPARRSGGRPQVDEPGQRKAGHIEINAATAMARKFQKVVRAPPSRSASQPPAGRVSEPTSGPRNVR
jgi:hypothetical protein